MKKLLVSLLGVGVLVSAGAHADVNHHLSQTGEYYPPQTINCTGALGDCGVGTLGSELRVAGAQNYKPGVYYFATGQYYPTMHVIAYTYEQKGQSLPTKLQVYTKAGGANFVPAKTAESNWKQLLGSYNGSQGCGGSVDACPFTADSNH